ncbi:MAG: ATP synthase subunit I [Burkholderiales bacterium]
MIDTTERRVDQGAAPEDDAQQGTFKTWTREEAQAWSKNNPPVSPWWVVAVQAAAGLVCCAAVWAFTQRSGAAWSALYGAAAVVVPGALLARGMTRDLSNVPGAAGHAVFRFMFWEMVKIGAAVAMLLAAPRVVPGLSWPALLVAMVVCMKMNWWALLWRRKPVMTEPTQRV